VGAGCVGTTDRSDFNEEIQARGGGLTPDLPSSAVDTVAIYRRADDTAGDIVMTLALESPRAAGTALFTGDGDLIEVVRA
jgi:hypothetical protein